MTTAVGERPFFVVGAPRSGTTLLRLMLAGHPRLAIPGESHFALRVLRDRSRDLDRSLEQILADDWFREWGLDPVQVRTAVEERAPSRPADLLRAVFSAYASSEGKPRWGDKTPHHARSVPLLGRAFPDAQFIHLVRDGRDAAASIASCGWASPACAGFWWRGSVSAAVLGGAHVGSSRYVEVRLEDLVADPEASLRRVCSFLGEDYTPALLRYAERVDDQLGAREQGWHRVEDLKRPPTGGLRDWREGLSQRDAASVEAACGSWLRRLGYPAAPRSARGTARAWAARSRNRLVSR